MTYTSCPACNGKRRKATQHPGQIFECRRCGTIYGDCYRGDSYALVRPHLTAEDVPAERCRYFDFTVLGSDGISRRHGWFDPETRLIVQIG